MPSLRSFILLSYVCSDRHGLLHYVNKCGLQQKLSGDGDRDPRISHPCSSASACVCDPSITGCLLLQERMSSLATAVIHATFTLHAFHQAHHTVTAGTVLYRM